MRTHPKYLESAVSNIAHMFPRSLYGWSLVVLLPILALVVSACGTGSNGGGLVY